MSRIGELLLKRSVITPEQLVQAMTDEREHGCGLAASLVRLGFVNDGDLVAYLQREYRFPVLDPRTAEPEPAALQLIPGQLARKRQVLPVSRNGATLTVALADPSNLVALNEIKFLSGCNVKIVLAESTALARAIDRHYGGQAKVYAEALHQLAQADVAVDKRPRVDLAEVERAAEDAPLVKLVNAIMVDAIQKRASDIHIEPYEKDLRIRFRIDGVLYDIMQPPQRYKNALSSRIKILSALDIAERRLPQDGSIKVRLLDHREVTFRVSVMPTIYGEKVVLRLLDKGQLEIDMTKLGFEPAALKHLKHAISQPYGMILVTGPTGSGKTTTLYSALNELNDSSRNISTAEDPVELNLRGINQVQINEDVGLTFAGSLRAFLRQDPDVIMVGEIRDAETAEIAVKAALTGHLVFSTLHTNDAPSAASRLLNMGVEPFLISSSLVLVAAQRLVRMICPYCKSPADGYAVEALREIGFSGDIAGLTLYRGRGCEDCSNTGYYGRIALYEMMPMTDEIRDLVATHATATAIKRMAISQGMKTLRQSGLRKAKEGLTTLEEVVRVTSNDA